MEFIETQLLQAIRSSWHLNAVENVLRSSVKMVVRKIYRLGWPFALTKVSNSTLKASSNLSFNQIKQSIFEQMFRLTLF